MGSKTMKMGWKHIQQSSLCPHFTPTTILHNPISWSSHTKCRKTIITQKVLITQRSNIVALWLAYPKNLYVQICKPLQTLFLCANWHFFSFLSGGVQETAKISYFVDFDWEKMHQNGLSGTYLGFEACQIQWHLFASLYNKQFMKNDNFRRHIVENGVQNHENGMETYPAVLLVSHFTPTPYFITQYLDLPIQNAEKP